MFPNFLAIFREIFIKGYILMASYNNVGHIFVISSH